MRKKLVDKIIRENKLNLINHLFFLALNIRNIDNWSNQLVKQIKVVNIYNN